MEWVEHYLVEHDPTRDRCEIRYHLTLDPETVPRSG